VWHRSRCARLLGALRFATRDGSQGTPPRTRTGLLRAGPHSLASSSKRSSSGCPWTRVPRCREPLGGGQSVGEVVTGRVGESATVHESPYTCSRIAGTRATTRHSIALRDVENPATLPVRCGSPSPLLRSRPSDRSSVYGGTGAR
jgi:hypothetical protein